MRNLFLLISKFGALILFVFLQIISLLLIINFNDKQKEIFLYSSNLLTGNINQQVDEWQEYLYLKTLNDSLLWQNARLLDRMYSHPDPGRETGRMADSSLYTIIPARIVNKTIHLRTNRITLDKGSLDGVTKDMGVITESGVVGVVHQVNSRFCSVMPVINNRFRLSASVKHKNYFGELIWEPYDERFSWLKYIPKHAGIEKGDTIVTSGYSTLFPPGISVGLIEEILLPPGSNYFDVKVRMDTDFASLEYVYLVRYRYGELKNEMDLVN